MLIIGMLTVVVVIVVLNGMAPITVSKVLKQAIDEKIINQLNI